MALDAKLPMSAEQTADHVTGIHDFLAGRDVATTRQVADERQITTQRARQILTGDPAVECVGRIATRQLGWRLRAEPTDPR
ncbi:MAG TPA: hypothetical protein VGC04_10605 [Cellulomonas sp.]